MADHREKERKIDKIVGEGGEELSLDWKHLNDSSMQYVASKQFSHVRAVNMIGNQFSYKAIGSFTGIRLNSLQELYFNFNNIGSKGCRLLTHGKWPCLRVLALESCNIENAGTAHLSKGEWKALQNLNLNENIITRDGLKHILNVHTPSLTSLDLCIIALIKLITPFLYMQASF